MSEIVTTHVGRFRRVKMGDSSKAWLWECSCGQWAQLSSDQWSGRVSVDHASDGCPNSYHETHNYGAELLAVMQSRLLTGDSPLDLELPEACPTCGARWSCDHAEASR